MNSQPIHRWVFTITLGCFQDARQTTREVRATNPNNRFGSMCVESKIAHHARMDIYLPPPPGHDLSYSEEGYASMSLQHAELDSTAHIIQTIPCQCRALCESILITFSFLKPHFFLHKNASLIIIEAHTHKHKNMLL